MIDEIVCRNFTQAASRPPRSEDFHAVYRIEPPLVKTYNSNTYWQASLLWLYGLLKDDLKLRTESYTAAHYVYHEDYLETLEERRIELEDRWSRYAERKLREVGEGRDQQDLLALKSGLEKQGIKWIENKIKGDRDSLTAADEHQKKLRNSLRAKIEVASTRIITFLKVVTSSLAYISYK
jgi:hypothetical protein